MATSALYYPYIRPRDDVWLKTAALVWHHVARIVPPNYVVRDSRTAIELMQAGILISEEPTEAVGEVGLEFLQLLAEEVESLRTRYSLDRFQGAHAVSRLTRGSTLGRDLNQGRVSWVHTIKVAPDLWAALQEHGLAVRDGDWVAFDTAVVKVYMAALAGRLASRGHFDAVTDQPDLGVLAGPWTTEELAAALLGEAAPRPSVTADEAEWRLAMCAIEMVAPAGVQSLTVEDVIRLRHESSAAFHAFRAKLETLQPILGAQLAGVEDERHMERIIAEVRDEHFGQELANLREALRDSNLLAVTKTLGVQLYVPVGAIGALAYMTSMPLIGVGIAAGVALGGIAASLVGGHHATRRGSHGAYLFDIEKAIRHA